MQVFLSMYQVQMFSLYGRVCGGVGVDHDIALLIISLQSDASRAQARLNQNRKGNIINQTSPQYRQ